MRIGKTFGTLELVLVVLPIMFYGAMYILGYITQDLGAFGLVMAVLMWISSLYFIPVAELFPHLFQHYAFVLVPNGITGWLAVAGFYSLCAFGIGSALLAIIGPDKKTQEEAEPSAAPLPSEGAPSEGR